MALRLIEIVLPDIKRENVEGVLRGQPVITFWNENITDERTKLKVLLTAEKTESVMDELEKRFSSMENFRIILQNVEASIPRVEEEEEETEEEKGESVERISREELYTAVSDASEFSIVYLGMMFFASIIAAVGVLRANIPVIIGAMIIAPMLGPNAALALSVTLGDLKLARKSIVTNLSGIFTAFAVSVVVGYFIDFSPEIADVVVMGRLGVGDFALAIAVGSAGALAYTSGISSTLIGVMIAVALLPPLVIFGMLLGGGYFPDAINAFTLFATNLICVNLAAIITFFIRGVRPLSWWEADRAKKATLIAVILWLLLLGALFLVIFL